MKQVKSIEMASSEELYQVQFLDTELTIKPDGEGFSILLGDEEQNWYQTKAQAVADLKSYAIDDDLVVRGFGVHSGRKFWQLPEELKEQILKMAA